MFSAENKDNKSAPSTPILSSSLPPSTSTSVLDVSTPTYSGPLVATMNNWSYPENHRLSIRIDPIVYQDRASLPGLAVLDAPGDGQRVLVTGAGGFIAAHVIELLLRRGYVVRATTRSIINMSTHLAHLSSIIPESDHKLQIVQMRLDEKDEAVWNGIVADCHYVLHLACPVSLFRHDDDAINTQHYITGTCSLLQACVHTSTVKRVVLTSCEVAITAGYQQDPTKQHHIFTESDWSQVTPDQHQSISGAYQRAKMACEQAAWAFMDQHRSASFTLTDCGLNSVDVRDVAIAHVRAMVAPEAASKRYLISGGWITLKEMAKVLDAEFSGRGYNIPTLSAPTALVHIMSLWDKNAASFLPDCGRSIRVNASSSCRELLMSYTPLPKAIVDEAYSLIALGVARNTLPIVHFRPDGSRVTWRPDDAVTRCNTCGDQFTVIRRKHHCRYCGEIFCRTCSSKRLDRVVPGAFERICDPCYSVHQNPHVLHAEEQAARKPNTVSTLIQDQDL